MEGHDKRIGQKAEYKDLVENPDGHASRLSASGKTPGSQNVPVSKRGSLKDGVHKCTLCGKVFMLRASYVVHMNKHRGKKYQCDICNKSYTASYSLKVHKRTHTGLKPYSCKVCGASFSTSGHCTRHEKLHSAENTQKADTSQKIVNKLAAACSEATERTQSGVASVETDMPRPSLMFVCRLCNKQFSCRNSLRVHKNKHLGRGYTCEVCGRVFTTSFTLQSHMLAHQNLKPHSCVTCGAAFRCRRNLVRHEKIHKGEKNAICEQCGKSFVDNGALGLHMKVHSKIGGIECPICRRTLKHRTSLKVHMKSHNTQKEFKCDVCHRQFAQKHSFLTHLTLHSNGKSVQKKAFLKPPSEFCSLCKKGFVDRVGLKRHMLKHKNGVLKRWKNGIELSDVTVKEANALDKESVSRRVKKVTVVQNVDPKEFDKMFVVVGTEVLDKEVRGETGGKEQDSRPVYGEAGVSDIGNVGTLINLKVCQEQNSWNSSIAFQDENKEGAKYPVIKKTMDDMTEGDTQVVRTANVNSDKSYGDVSSDSINDMRNAYLKEGNEVCDKEKISDESCNHVERDLVPGNGDSYDSDDGGELVINFDEEDENNVRKQPLDTVAADHDKLTIQNRENVQIQNSLLHDPYSCHIKDIDRCNKGTMSKSNQDDAFNKNGNGLLSDKTAISFLPETYEITTQNAAKESCNVGKGKLSVIDGKCLTNTVISSIKSTADILNSSGSDLKNGGELQDKLGNRSPDSVESEIVCRDCGKGFKLKANLNRHVKKNHPNSLKKALYKCNFDDCQYSTTSAWTLAKHQRSHGPVHQCCQFCPAKFSNKSGLKTHLRRKHGEKFENINSKNEGNSKENPDKPLKNHNSLSFSNSCLDDKDVLHSLNGTIREASKGDNIKNRYRTMNRIDNNSNYQCHEDALHSSGVQKRNECAEFNLPHIISNKSEEIPKNAKEMNAEIINEDMTNQICETTLASGVNYGISKDSSKELQKGITVLENEIGKDCFTQYEIGRKEKDSQCYSKREKRIVNTTSHENLISNISRSNKQMNEIYQQSNEGKVRSCRYCSLSFNSDTSLQHHENMHSQTGNFVCSLCGRKFQQSSHLHRHKESKCCIKKIHCKDCGATFQNEGNLNVHLKKVHNRFPYKCPVCDKAFATTSGRNRHKRFHVDGTEEVHLVRDHMCSVCGKRYTSASSLSNHLLQHSTTARPFQCEMCGNAFSQRSHLKRHIMSTHRGIKRFVCDLEGCGKKFVDKGAWKVHQRSHTGEKPFTCDVCQKSFQQAQSLNIHRRIHFNIKEFTCEYCKQTFSTKNSMQRHAQRHEKSLKMDPNSSQYDGNFSARLKQKVVKKMAEKKIRCKHCAKGFTTRRGLVAHVRKRCTGMIKVDTATPSVDVIGSKLNVERPQLIVNDRPETLQAGCGIMVAEVPMNSETYTSSRMLAEHRLESGEQEWENLVPVQLVVPVVSNSSVVHYRDPYS